MIDPFELYDLRVNPTEVPLGLPLIAGLTGFSDSGGTIAQVSETIFANFDTKVIVQFQNDELLDYRSRRPVMYFEKDHIVSYEPSTLALYLVSDEAGNPFLFLQGYEPDFKWDAFVRALKELFELFAVASVTWVHSVPFPVPHTKPVGVTVSGNRKDLIASLSEWKPSTNVPGNVLHVLEYELAETGMPMAGIVLLVPHYLGDNEYPEAAITAFQHLTTATGLVFTTDPLREEQQRFLRRLNKQIDENSELQRVISQLEQGYLSGETFPGRPQMEKPPVQVPSADEIAAELEDYLASRLRNDSDSESDGDGRD